MSTQGKLFRRDLLKSMGIGASVSALPTVAGAQAPAAPHTARPLPGLPELPASTSRSVGGGGNGEE
jgi:hypothetical protein